MESTDFAWALRQVKSGCMIYRNGWNGPKQWVAMQTPDANSKMGLPYLYIKTVQGKLVPWHASQTDILADDWRVVTGDGSTN